MTISNALFVLITNDALLARNLTVVLPHGASVTIAHSADAAMSLLTASQGIAGVLLDQAVLGTDCMRVIRKVRSVCPLASVVLLTSTLEVSLINELQLMGIALLTRPLPNDALATYVQRALARGRLTDTDVTQWVEHLSSARGLSAADRALIPLILDSETPEAACLRLGFDRQALERGLRRIVRKCRVRNTDRLARNLWRDALLSRRAETRDWLSAPKRSAAL